MAVDVGSLALEITGRCNRDCVYCYNDWRGQPAASSPVELETGALLALVEQLVRDTGVRHITVSGGEPLTRPDALELLNGLARLNLGISLVSDGGLLDEHLASRLAEVPVSLVQLTLLAAQQEAHDALKRIAPHLACLGLLEAGQGAQLRGVRVHAPQCPTLP